MARQLFIYLTTGLLLFISCQSSKINVHFESEKIDSFRVDIVNPINGTQLFSQKLGGKNKTLTFDSLINDPVEIKILWNREHIPHDYVKPMQKHEAFYGPTEDFFVLTKIVYINADQSKDYTLMLPNKTTSEIELAVKNKADKSTIKLNTSSKDAKLFDEFMDIYDTKDKKIVDSLASLSKSLYKANDLGNLDESKKIQKNIVSKSWKDAIEIQHQKTLGEKIIQNNESPISTFILFWEMYAYRKEFKTYEATFNLLKNDAVDNKYYKAIETIYKKK